MTHSAGNLRVLHTNTMSYKQINRKYDMFKFEVQIENKGLYVFAVKLMVKQINGPKDFNPC